jgi:hypothetical protein
MTKQTTPRKTSKALESFFFFSFFFFFFRFPSSRTLLLFSRSSSIQRSSRTCRGRWWVRPRKACEDERESRGQCSFFAFRLHSDLVDASCRWACRHSLGDPCRSWFCRRWPSFPPATFRPVTADLQSSTHGLSHRQSSYQVIRSCHVCLQTSHRGSSSLCNNSNSTDPLSHTQFCCNQV